MFLVLLHRWERKINLSVLNQPGGRRGFYSGDTSSARGIRTRSARIDTSRPGHVALPLTDTHRDEGPTGAQSHGHLREDGQVSAAAPRRTGATGRGPAEGAVEARAERGAQAVVRGGPRGDPPPMPPGPDGGRPRHLREAALRGAG